MDPDAGKDWKQKRVAEDDNWIASPIQWTWTWANSGRRWGTGSGGVLQSMELQRVRNDLVTEQQQHSFVNMYHNFLIHSSVSGHLGCFHVQDIVNSAIATLFIAAKKYKQPKCSSTDERIYKMWHTQRMKYYSAIKGNELQIHATTWKNFENIMLREDPLEKVEATHSSILAWGSQRVGYNWATCTFTFKWKKSVPKDHILYNSIYIICPE